MYAKIKKHPFVGRWQKQFFISQQRQDPISEPWAIYGNDFWTDEKIVEQNLYTKEQADPDLIVRTAGETRLSNFLLWQSAYSELYFTKKTWPDFNTSDFNSALDYYKSRARTFGATKMKKKSS